MKKHYFLYIIPILLISTILAAPSPKLYLNAASDKPVYKSGEPIGLALTVLNINTRTYQANFTSGKKYDFYLYQEERLVWKWSADKMFTMALSTVPLEPRKPVTFLTVFQQKLPSGELLNPGRYQLVGVFCLKEQEYRSEPVIIEIR